ncbi:hypothetical protein DFH08DRAFT_987654 [Mycena albidolilacea]|uniref:Pali-domain-containing protein n=1 Tax=Mycena albidolilacea TaxID=1033008 RepID=A0AAD7AA79_9AGAR|nr:hypothetical protein DFH08DRAFT_987654 [Mycena albidolilacea]
MLALHFGTFLIFSGLVLLIVASISAPTVAKIDFLSIPLTNGSSVNFGTLGFCILNPDGNSCTPTAVGYRIADEVSSLGIDAFSDDQATTIYRASKALVLNQIAAGIAGIAFLLAVCSHRLGYLFASAVAFVAFLFSLGALIVDFVVFGAVKQQLGRNGGTSKWGSAIWLVLVATIILFLASIATCFAYVL